MVAEIGEVSVKEAYRGYASPVNAAKIIRRLLTAIPAKYVRGLDCVVLTNLSGQPRRHRLGKTTSRGRRISQSRVLGRYHPKWRGQPPWIELYIDQILSRLPRWAIRIPAIREVMIGSTLYHELGHHVHMFIRPEFREKEDVADDWGKKFSAHFFRREYWYLIPIVKFILLFRK
jgi:hypothetical protein